MNEYKKNSTDCDFQLRILEKPIIECPDVEELLSDYIDHELIPTLHARVGAHIMECAVCSESEEDIRMVIELAATIKDTPVPIDVRERLRQNLNDRLGLSLSM